MVKGPICKAVNTKKPGKKMRCSPPSHTVDLTNSFAQRRLKPGARITVEIARPKWIGKYYVFKMVAHASPRVQIVVSGARRQQAGRWLLIRPQSPLSRTGDSGGYHLQRGPPSKAGGPPVRS